MRKLQATGFAGNVNDVITEIAGWSEEIDEVALCQEKLHVGF